MRIAPLPSNEPARMEALEKLGLLDRPAERRLGRLTRLAADAFEVPYAALSLVERDRQFFLACVGLGVRQTPRGQVGDRAAEGGGTGADVRRGRG